MSESLAARLVGVNVVIDGVSVAGATRLELYQRGAFYADRFDLIMALLRITGASYYAGLSTALIRIYVTFNSPVGIGETLIVGQIDGVTIDFSTGTARLSGRDLSARLIDAEVNQSFANQTASDIATSFAAAAGLTSNTIPTRTPIGQYYELSHTRTALGLHTRNSTQWELLAVLAEVEAYSLSVIGTTLNFLPLSTPGAPITLIYGRDLMTLSIDRAVSLVNAKVTVRSWNTRLKIANQNVQGTGISTTLIKPNLMPDQVKNFAVSKQAELVAQTNLLNATMAGETNLLPQTWINLQGTNTTFDGLYIIQAIERHIDAQHGFTQVIEAYATG